jgi:hypothetical protein
MRRILIVGLFCCSLGATELSPLQGQAAATPALQIDHILIQTPQLARFKSFLVDTLDLPLVWPQPGDRWQTSVGVAIGDVSLELFGIADTLSAFVGSLAIEAVDFDRAHRFLESQTIAHGEPSRWPPGDSVPPSFTTMGIPGMGLGVFFIRYDTFDMSERRRRYDGLLRSRAGGRLGLRRIAEVQVAIPADAPGRKLWATLFGVTTDGLWQPAGGPAVRLSPNAPPGERLLVAEVVSIAKAEQELRRLGIDYTLRGNRLRLDPARLYGLLLELVEQNQVGRTNLSFPDSPMRSLGPAWPRQPLCALGNIDMHRGNCSR